MTLWWIGNIALFAVFAVVVYLLHGVLSAALLLYGFLAYEGVREQLLQRLA